MLTVSLQESMGSVYCEKTFEQLEHLIFLFLQGLFKVLYEG